MSLLADATDFRGDAANYGLSLAVLSLGLTAAAAVIRHARMELITNMNAERS